MARVIISGGGTGGHIFPAVAIARALQRLQPDTEILFVGALGRMEMEKVPAAGFRIIGLDIQGIQRKSILKNLALPFKLWKSLRKAKQIVRDFKPDIAVGVGGYASGPLLYAAANLGITTVLQEQNSYAGITNKKLGKKARQIYVAFDGMNQFFPADKIIKTGNPIRRDAVDIDGKRFAAAELLHLDPKKKTILVTGGSLGAGTLNKAMLAGWKTLAEKDVQLIWQTGKRDYASIKEMLGDKLPKHICVREFLNRMDLAYAAADVIISRAGAGTLAELCVVKKPVVLVPSPNVAEDHQTKNAMALVEKHAAVMVPDAVAENALLHEALELIRNEEKAKQLAKNIGEMALPFADETIAKHIFQIIN
ncbi:MAG: undecaprenyldiphospho-muramoylpentapeptide beta-N-acetylglucosaminyltransferase [Mucilaginibacter polytrichastri]|nr:undecaprenyldiphospho-muramoylpentapeptide beta-N-acetylglucosaminyltransferase [Mucilaginibacter polytrichastri]